MFVFGGIPKKLETAVRGRLGAPKAKVWRRLQS